MRLRIGARLAAVWLALAIPLCLALVLAYAGSYATRLALVSEDCVGNAQLSGAAFDLLLQDMQRTMAASGRGLLASNGSSATAAAELRRMAGPYPVDYAAQTDATGRVTRASDARLVGIDLSRDAAFLETMRTNKRSGIEPSEVTSEGLVGFHVVHGINGPDGRLVGTLLMFVDVRQLHKRFPVSAHQGGISIIDPAGQVVFQSEYRVFAETQAQWGSRYAPVRSALAGRATTTTDLAFPVGGPRIGAFTPIEPIGWVAGSTVDRGTALAPLSSGLAVGLPVTLALLGLAVALAVALSRNITTGLGALAASARRIGSGDLSEPVRADRADEIGDVARSLEGARIDLARYAHENAELYAAEVGARTRASQELETTRVLLEAARAQAAWTDVERLLKGLAAVILEATSHTRAFIFLWDEKRRELRRAASKGKDPFPSGATFPFDNVAAPTKDALKDGRVRLLDFDAMTDEERGTALAASSPHLVLEVPLVWHGRVAGIIGVDDPGERREFTEREVELVAAIASQAAVAVENARLFETQQETARYNAALAEIDASLHATLDVDVISRQAVEAAAVALGANTSALGLLHESGFELKYLYGARPQIAENELTPEQARFAMLALDRDDPVVCEDTWQDERVDRETMDRFGTRAAIRQRLFVRGRPTGILGFDFAEPKSFSPAELEFVRKLGSTLSLALENAMLYATEHDIAETLQTALLAMPDRVQGVEFAHAYRSATEAARVGGDFYDLFELEPGVVGVTVGDIAGHGVDAAVLTSLVKSTIRAHAMEPGKTPADVMESVNAVLYRGSAAEVFATVFFGMLDTADGRLVYCNAGHTTAACVSRGGGAEPLAPTAPLVGAFLEATFTDAKDRLQEGDQLFLYTDGLTEARRDTEFFGEERLFEILSAETPAHPEETVRRIVEAVMSFAGGQLSDDMAILSLCLHRGEEAAEGGVPGGRPGHKGR